MIKRIAFSAVFLTLLLILQSTWLGFMSISSVIPDLATLALVYISFKSPGMQGQITGFICGLLQDGVSAAPFGLNAFVKTILAWFFNMISGTDAVKNVDRICLQWHYRPSLFSHDGADRQIYITVGFFT